MNIFCSLNANKLPIECDSSKVWVFYAVTNRSFRTVFCYGIDQPLQGASTSWCPRWKRSSCSKTEFYHSGIETWRLTIKHLPERRIGRAAVSDFRVWPPRPNLLIPDDFSVVLCFFFFFTDSSLQASQQGTTLVKRKELLKRKKREE